MSISCHNDIKGTTRQLFLIMPSKRGSNAASSSGDSKRAKHTTHNTHVIDHVKEFHSSDSAADIIRYYRKHQLVLIKNCKDLCPSIKKDIFGMDPMRRLYSAAKAQLSSSFSVETAKMSDTGWSTHTADTILGTETAPSGSWYTSFIAQHDSDSTNKSTSEFAAMQAFYNSLPFSTLPLNTRQLKDLDISHTDPVWVFIGRNCNQAEEDVLVRLLSLEYKLHILVLMLLSCWPSRTHG